MDNSAGLAWVEPFAARLATRVIHMGYRDRLHELEQRAEQLASQLRLLRLQSDRYSHLRLTSFVLAGLASGLTLLTAGVWFWLFLTPAMLLPFAILVFRHRRVEEAIIIHEIRLGTVQGHVARMTLDWEGIPPAAPVPPNFEHPFATDLDLLGNHSLHQLMDTAVSHEGSQRLLAWLLDTDPQPARIAARHACVRELVGVPDFRDDLSLNARLAVDSSHDRWQGQRLLDWLASHPADVTSARRVLFLLFPLALANVTLGILNAAAIVPGWWLFTWLLYAAFSLAQLRKHSTLFQDAFFLRDGLLRLSTVFRFLESNTYVDLPNLRALCAPFLGSTTRPSLQLKEVSRIVAAIGLQRNQFLWIFVNALVPWDIYAGYRMSRVSQELSLLLPEWLDVWYELEALASLANHAYLNPAATFPEIRSACTASPDSDICFAANALGHPLILESERVCNDFTVRQTGSLDIITGSNMAGKSTFLRTLGINLAMAYAGGPVIAQQMQLSIFRLFTAIRVTDSVTDGFSYFYAEVRRLKKLLTALQQEGEAPLFYLIDEIFRGTNNRERLIGSHSFVQALAGENGVGVIATHDLELVRLEEDTGGVKNYHFRDNVVDGRMVFDYKLYPGPCPTTNALKIMRLAGLPVGDDR